MYLLFHVNVYFKKNVRKSDSVKTFPTLCDFISTKSVSKLLLMPGNNIGGYAGGVAKYSLVPGLNM